MIFKFNKSKEVIFISMLGVNLTKGHFSKIGICDEMTMSAIIDLILDYNTQQIVIDCSSLIYTKDQKVFEKFTTHSQIKDREVIFFNIEQQLERRLQTDLVNNDFEFVNEDLSNEYFSKSKFLNVLINITSLSDLDYNICEEIKENDGKTLNHCVKDFTREGYKLKSTPLWTNYYIEINSIFKKKPSDSCWLLSRLCQILRDRIGHNTKILLTSTSLNGTILTSFIKEILSDSYTIELVCFDRLGPDLTINEMSANKKDKYDYIIYLCDFIIGGTEFKILQAMLSLRNLKVTDVIAVGSYSSMEESKIDNIPFKRVFHLPTIVPKIKYGLTQQSVIDDT